MFYEKSFKDKHNNSIHKIQTLKLWMVWFILSLKRMFSISIQQVNQEIPIIFFQKQK